MYRLPRVFALCALLYGIPAIGVSAEVSGVVSAVDGEPVVAAAVRVPALDRSALTDSTGAFRVSPVPPGAHTLVVSALGYRTDTILVRAPSTGLRLALEELPVQLDPVSVSAERIELVERTTAFVARVSPDESPSPAATIPELLEQSVGIRVKSTGGMGSFSTISLRASTSEQVRVYLDGIPLNQALGGGVNIASIPASSVERVDIYRGVIPPEYGGSGTAGVVDFRTRSSSDTLRWRLRSSYGTWDSRIANGWLSGGHGPLSGVVSFDYSHSRNDFPFWDDNGTRYNEEDDAWATRTNNQFTSYNLLSRVSWEAPAGWRLTGSYHYTWTKDHLPGVSTAHELENHTYLKTAQHLAEVKVARPLPLLSTLEAQVYRSWRRDRFDNREGVYALGKKLTADTTAVLGARATLATLALPWQRIALDASRQWESFQPDNKLLTNEIMRRQQLIERKRTQTSVYLSDEISLPDNVATLTGNIGYLRVRNSAETDPDLVYFTHVDTTTGQYWPRAAGLMLRPVPWLAARANYGRYVRVPNLYELFGDRGTTMGNEELLPERGRNLDLGIELSHYRRFGFVRGARAEAVYFHNTVDDMIVFWHVHGRSKAFNMNAARITGFETSASLRTSFGASLSGNFVWQKPRNVSTTQDSMYYGNDLPGHPRKQMDLRADYTLGPVTVFYGLGWNSSFYSQPINRLSDVVPAAWLHDAGVRLRIGHHVSITAEGKNLGDVKEFHTRFVPLPGRSWFVTLEAGSQ